MKKLSDKEKLFCYFYAKTNSVKQAAVKSGHAVKSAERWGARQLERKEISACIRKYRQLEQKDDIENLAGEGLKRIAFAQVNDAVNLLMQEDSMETDDIARLDLTGVSQIKRGKGGVLEISFFDKMEALKMLMEKGKNNTEKADEESFARALENAAKSLDEKAESGINEV